MRQKIVFLDAYTMNPGDLDFSGLAELGDFVSYDRTNVSEVKERTKGAEIIIVNKFPVNAETLPLMPDVKYVCVAATGFNNLDIPILKARGIQASNVRNYSTDSVAQHVFASILGWYNRIESYDASVKNGDWSGQEDFCYYHQTIKPITGKALGIAGFGAIGQKVAAIGKAFGMKILVHTRSSIQEDLGIKQVSKEVLLEYCDVISLHMPLTEDTKHWISRQEVEIMDKDTLLINTARGPLVDADALLDALQNEKIGGAVLDVLDVEPPKNPHPVIFHKNCLVTPHIAWAGLDARKLLLDGLIYNIKAYQRGAWINPVYEI